MEQGLVEYFARLSNKFWQIGNNPKIKFEFGYEDRLDNGGMDWFSNGLHVQFMPEQFDLDLSVKFYRFYASLVEDEPSMVDFLSTVPLSYHKILINNCYDFYEALAIIAKALENDWSKNELINYFAMSRN